LSCWTHLGIDVGYFLDRAALTRSAMFSSDHAAIGSLTEFFHELILGIHHKGRIEGGEGVPLHVVWLVVVRKQDGWDPQGRAVGQMLI
jgi:hypothetical protein